MKNVPRFLTLFSFLLAISWLGCAASQAQIQPKKADTPVKAKADTRGSPGSMYEETVKNSPLMRALREEMPEERKGSVEFLCVPTGDFNITPDLQVLRMGFWCEEKHPPKGYEPLSMNMEDASFPRMEGGQNIYQIPFEDSFVILVEAHGVQKVRLHYRDTNGKFGKVLLPRQKGGRYAFSVGNLAPDSIHPIDCTRSFELQLK